MKKLICFSFAALSFVVQGVAVAQQQSNPISEVEYQIVISAICQSSEYTTVAEIADAVVYEADSSLTVSQVEKLQEIAVGMLSLPEIEKDRLCMG